MNAAPRDSHSSVVVTFFVLRPLALDTSGGFHIHPASLHTTIKRVCHLRRASPDVKFYNFSCARSKKELKCHTLWHEYNKSELMGAWTHCWGFAVRRKTSSETLLFYRNNKIEPIKNFGRLDLRRKRIIAFYAEILRETLFTAAASVLPLCDLSARNLLAPLMMARAVKCTHYNFKRYLFVNRKTRAGYFHFWPDCLLLA